MKKKGSVTMFFSLFMAVFLLLIQVMFRSVQIAGGRVQAEAGVEEGLYSVFAGYDRELFERYRVFFLDGGYGTGTLQSGRMYHMVEDSLMKSCFPGKKSTDIRGENLWNCSKESGNITGYTLASDQCGRAFQIQAVDYMKETAGIQGIQLLLEKDRRQNEILANQEREGTLEQAKAAQNSYEEARKQAEQKPVQQEQPRVPSDFSNPLDVIGQLRERGILSLVLPSDAEISQGNLGEMIPLKERHGQTGMGILHYGRNPDTVADRLIFQEYMLQYLTHYGNCRPAGAQLGNRLLYQLEYAVAGKKTDMENLKAVVQRLLAIREAANMVYLMKDPVSQAQIQETALLICAATGLPVLEGVVSLALEAAWAFGESVMDVRGLLQGEKVPLIKTAESWKLSLENLGNLAHISQEKQKNAGEGMSYKEYLRILLSMGKTEDQVLRTMDVVEQTMKTVERKQNFRMDLCVSYLQVEMGISCAGEKFSIQRGYGYEM